MTAPEGAEDEEIERTLREWTQGDCVVGKQGFFYRVGPGHTSVSISVSIASVEIGITGDEVAGLMVLTQTCDIVRDPGERPLIEVSPLIGVADESLLNEIKLGLRPRYAFVPGLEKQRLAADLDRVMTIEKQVMVKWERVAGCATDDDRQRLAQALARKRSRFAFPDDFTEFVKPLSVRLRSKHGKAGDEGRALQNLREIRVRAEPSWAANEIRLVFLFIPEQKQSGAGRQKPIEHLDSWLHLIPPSGRFVNVEGLVMEFGGIPASEYVKSAPLDLDHLTSRAPRDTGSTAS